MQDTVTDFRKNTLQYLGIKGNHICNTLLKSSEKNYICIHLCIYKIYTHIHIYTHT